MPSLLLQNLVPRKGQNEKAQSIITLLMNLTVNQWGIFLSCWLAWTCTAVDFFFDSLATADLATQFGRSATEITFSINLTLLCRAAGSIIFGLYADRFGRKWPLVLCLTLSAILTLGAGFTHTLSQFLVLRSFFAICMGGVWGLGAVYVLENLPIGIRGLASGIFQMGHPFGYLLAGVINLTLVPESSSRWHSLYWISAGLTFLSAVVCSIIPEAPFLSKANRSEKKKEMSAGGNIRWNEIINMLKTNWFLWLYACLLMTCFSFLFHGTQDGYPGFLQFTKGFTLHGASVVTIIGNCGGIVGTVVAGGISQITGRRLAIATFMFILGAFIPLWILPSSFGALAAASFIIQYCVGSWGVIPIHLAELSPSEFRATFVGVTYQIGNMIGASAGAVGSAAAKGLTITAMEKGVPTVVPDLVKVQGILTVLVAGVIFILALISPEKHGIAFEKSTASEIDIDTIDDGGCSTSPVE